MDDEENSVPSRSSTTLWRRQGSRKRRYEYQGSDSEQEDAGELQPASLGAPTESSDDQVLDDENGEVVQHEEEAAVDALQPLQHDSDNNESDSDSGWSDEIRNNHVEEDSDEDFNPLGEEERDFVVQGEDDPDNQGYESSSDSASDNEEDNLNDPSLNELLNFTQMRTVKESLLLDLALAVRHKLTYECIVENLQTKNILFGRKFFPWGRRRLLKILGRDGSGVQSHIYCSGCSFYLGKRQKFGNVVVCHVCGVSKRIEKASFFVSLSIKKQLEHFLKIASVAEHLRYRENRIKKNEEAIEDIFDGSEYQIIEVDGEKLMNSNHFTYTFNTDGCKISKGAKTSIYPLFLRINELPPHLRQKFMFLAGVFVDKKEPSMMGFLSPFVKQLNKLSSTGILWTRNNVEVRSKFLPTCFCVDGKARAQILNMVSHTGHFSCLYCTYNGIRVNNTMRYPIEHEGPIEKRTHASVQDDMFAADHGFKGPSQLALLDSFDLVKGAAADDLHYFYECASLQHTELLLTMVPRVDQRMGDLALCEAIDVRLQAFRTPSAISRKPGTCKLKNRKQKKGTEWRNWLVYYAPICLQNLIPNHYIKHIELLSHATFLLSKDIITNEDIETAERYIEQYLVLYEQYFGIESTRLNLHSLLHAPDSVRHWGGLWCYSTFNFESWNHKIMQHVSSPNGALQQIVTRFMFQSSLEAAMFADNNVSLDVKDQISKILNKKDYVVARQVGDRIYVLGTPVAREPTPEELMVLEREGLHTQDMQVFKKIIVNSVKYTSPHQEDTKSDNSSIFTFQNTFCTIKSIVTFVNHDEREICGMFVWEHEVVQQERPLFCYAKHIIQVQEHDADLLHFLHVDLVRSPVVKAHVLGAKFFIPMPNTNEID